MKTTLKKLKEALMDAAQAAEDWKATTVRSCESTFQCHITGFEWPANRFGLSLGLTDRYGGNGVYGNSDEIVSPASKKPEVNMGYPNFYWVIEKICDDLEGHYASRIDGGYGFDVAEEIRSYAKDLKSIPDWIKPYLP